MEWHYQRSAAIDRRVGSLHVARLRLLGWWQLGPRLPNGSCGGRQTWRALSPQRMPSLLWEICTFRDYQQSSFSKASSCWTWSRLQDWSFTAAFMSSVRAIRRSTRVRVVSCHQMWHKSGVISFLIFRMLLKHNFSQVSSCDRQKNIWALSTNLYAFLRSFSVSQKWCFLGGIEVTRLAFICSSTSFLTQKTYFSFL